MDPVNNLGRVIETLRQQLAERAAKAGERAPAGSATVASTGQPRAAGIALADVQRRVQDRIRALDPNDPRRESKATRIFLETVLQRELGDSIANDPAFFTMIDEVQAQVEADARIRAALTELVARLARA